MYQVKKIITYQATRDIELLNEETGTVDVCFDDSALVSFTNFLFIQEGEHYQCRIKLFGDFVLKPTNTSTPVKVIKTEILIGNKKFIEVMIEDDLYYIPESKAQGVILHEIMHFDFTRKDLIQVDDVIHDDCF